MAFASHHINESESFMIDCTYYIYLLFNFSFLTKKRYLCCQYYRQFVLFQESIMIDIRLKVFNNVAQYLSFTQAARELFVSQPAISKHIRELESEYECRLFDRNGQQIQLTAAGERLFRHSRHILEAYRKMDFDMHALRQKVVGELHIGASTTIAQYIIPSVMADFRKHYRDTGITLMSGNSREVETALLKGRIDIGLVEGIIKQSNLKYTPFLNDEIVIIANTHGPCETDMTIDDLKHRPIVLRERGSGTLDVIESVLANKGILLSDLHIEMHIGSTEGIKHYVEQADCIGMVSISSVGKEVADGRFKIVNIKGVKMKRILHIVEKQGETEGTAKLFKQFLTRQTSMDTTRML